jgi:beta-galactosidase
MNEQQKNTKKFAPVMKDFGHMIHGADYNPDQWLDMPDILQEDVRLLKLAHMNAVSIGIFSWKALEPKEGVYTFEWLDELMDRLAANGIGAVLATPSGARPAWMDRDHPEVLRVSENRVRNLHGFRHNHCYTAPYYRDKVREMNTLLAKRYGKHPALKLWHVSNEYGGECHCPLCQEAFRNFLREKYDNDIHKLNGQWWTRFWSHEFSDFDEIESPAPHGENQIHGMHLDWMRFVTAQTKSFMENEIAPLKEITPDIPVTTNMMGVYPGLNYWDMAPSVDVISWDNYPEWHNPYSDDEHVGCRIAFMHDINRSMKHKPFLLMESTPSQINWRPVNKLKRPGMHSLSSIQAVAHGADSVQYFQFRKGRGASEKFHGAVVDHYGKEDTRVFREVARLGEDLEKMDEIVGTVNVPEVALIYDWENRWAIEHLQGLNQNRDYEGTCVSHYKPFWNMGMAVDVNCMTETLGHYKLVTAPMLYMTKPGVTQALRDYVKEGGTLVLTYCSSYVNENDLCYMGGFPGELMDVAGVWAEEIDPLYPQEKNSITLYNYDKAYFRQEQYQCKDLCEIIHAKEGTEVLAVYDSDFYTGMPAVVKHPFGKGTCYYIATRTEEAFLEDFYHKLADTLNLSKPMYGDIPEGVSVQSRFGDGMAYDFIMNFNSHGVTIQGAGGINLLDGKEMTGEISLEPYGWYIIKHK